MRGAAHLDRLKAALDEVASRDGRGLTEKFEFSLENQVGRPLWSCEQVSDVHPSWVSRAPKSSAA